MILNSDQVKRLYRRLAPVYDAVLLPFRLLGLNRHRKEAVGRLRLKPGDTAVDMGGGTGLNLPILYDYVGPAGRIICVDLTSAMLDRARERVIRQGFSNVELVQADLASYDFPSKINGAVATYSLEMIPAYDAIIRSVAARLPEGGRMASYGLKQPEKWPDWLVQIGIFLTKPFGTSREYTSFHPWESIRRHLKEVEYREFLFGAAYLSVGERRKKRF
jgi:ubiquinone/menaquinone biosynthesis C-methylase UbiE